MLANRVRQEVSRFLTEINRNFIEFFRKSIMKESSFLEIMTNEVCKKVSVQEIKQFINFKNMRLPGKGINLKPLYELVVKCKQTRGVLYILGKKEKILPQSLSNIKERNGYNSISINELTLGYHLIDLPVTVTCKKVCCGDDFVLVLSHSGKVFS